MMLLYNTDIDKTYTVEDFIDLGKDIDDIQYSKYSILSKLVRKENKDENFILYPSTNVIYDYEEEFKSRTLEVEMTDVEFTKYRYKPKLLSFDLYGTTEMYFIILFINGMCSIKEFNRKNIKLIKKDILNELMETIYNAESDYISSNRASIGYDE